MSKSPIPVYFPPSPRREVAAQAVIDRSAAVFAARIVQHAGGSLPFICKDRGCERRCGHEEWIGLLSSFGLMVAPLRACPPRFTARLIYDERYDIWVFQYNVRHDCYSKVRYCLHEMVELIAIEEFPSDHDEALRVRGFNYNGDPEREDVRHEIARRAESLLMGDRTVQPELLSLFREQLSCVGGVIHHQIRMIEQQLRIIGSEAEEDQDAECGGCEPQVSADISILTP
jgi:hypothetical protein